MTDFIAIDHGNDDPYAEEWKDTKMEFSYKELGRGLAWNRMQKSMRQSDVEILSGNTLKQPAISAAERGETRLAVDTFVTYCNVLGIRPDSILEPFLTTEPDSEYTGAIVDPYVVQLAALMSECSLAEKEAIIKIAEIIRNLHGRKI